jgi:hypothetical protein
MGRSGPFSLLCRIGLHSWTRTHGTWREIVVEPTVGLCRRCGQPIESVWRSVYPNDGSRCKPGSCPFHDSRH